MSVVNPHSTLKSLTIVIRHGDMSPVKANFKIGEVYPNNPYRDHTFPDGFGALTNEGKRRCYNLGISLRDKYDAFLGEAYRSTEVLSMSTDTDRTTSSLLLVLAGLFPPKKEQIWEPKLLWQPIPYETIPIELTPYIKPTILPSFRKQLADTLASSKYKCESSKFDKLRKELNIHAGSTMEHPLSFIELYHTLACQQNMNLTLPEWTKSYFPNGPLKDATLFAYESLSYTPELRRLHGGAFLKKMLDNMLDNRTRKISLYCCHEINIAAFLIAMKTWNRVIPFYSSAVILELHEINSRDFIRIQYRRGDTSEYEVLKLPGKPEYFLLEDFLETLKDVLAEDVELPSVVNV